MYYAIGAAIGAWVGRAILWIFANKLGTILLGSGLAITSFAGVSFIVGQIEDAIAQGFSISQSANVSGVAVGQLAWQMFKLAGGGDAVLMILAAYTSRAAIEASRVFLARVTGS